MNLATRIGFILLALMLIALAVVLAVSGMQADPVTAFVVAIAVLVMCAFAALCAVKAGQD